MKPIKKQAYKICYGVYKGCSLKIQQQNLFASKSIILVVDFESKSIELEFPSDTEIDTSKVESSLKELFVFDELDFKVFMACTNSNISEIAKKLSVSRGYVRERFKDLNFKLEEIKKLLI